MAKDLLIGVIKSILNLIFLCGGILSLIIALFCFIKPSLLKQLSSTSQKVFINLEDIMMKNSKVWGVIFLVLALLLIYFGITVMSLI